MQYVAYSKNIYYFYDLYLMGFIDNVEDITILAQNE